MNIEVPKRQLVTHCWKDFKFCLISGKFTLFEEKMW